ncbi:MAG: multidrug efflux SMR transporter [Rhodospirillales bacterium]|nr:multidrug efflux SMR transporter [Rhodospirillales bacterium]
MAWLYLILAGIFEWGWPMGLKFGWTADGVRAGPLIFAAACIVASGGLLLLAQREIPVGTAYAVWTGIGAVGTFFLGIWLLGEPANVGRYFFVGLIVVGIIGLKLASAPADGD